MELGSLDLDKSQWKKLAHTLSFRLLGKESLFESDPEIAEVADKAISGYDFLAVSKEDKAEIDKDADFVNVDLTSVAASSCRSLGPELVGNEYFEKLKLTGILEKLSFSPKEIALAKAVIISRLVAPSSDLATHGFITSRSALLEILDYDISSVGKDAVYEICDELLLAKEEIEAELVNAANELFPTNRRLFLFDLTNTYFEGTTLGNNLAKYGHSKEKRNDCTLVSLALLVDDRGLPIYSHIYGGNQSEPETLKDVLDRIADIGSDGLFSEVAPSIVMDRGIATKDNIATLKEYGYPYLVISRGPVEREYLEEFNSQRETFTRITDNDSDNGDNDKTEVYVKSIPHDGGTRVLCFSQGRKQKEHAIDEKRTTRFLDDVTKLQSSIRAGNLKAISTLERRIGAINTRHRSVARLYDLNLRLDELSSTVVDLEIVEKKDKIAAKAALFGAYVIDTSHSGISGEEIWHLYMTLTKVEDAFRSLKSDLGMRPVYHQLARRTEAHLFVSVLAYHLLAAITLTLRQQGDKRSFQTIKDQLSTHIRMTVMLRDDQDQIHHIRLSSTPEPTHREIYRLLEVKDPLKAKRTIIAQM